MKAQRKTGSLGQRVCVCLCMNQWNKKTRIIMRLNRIEDYKCLKHYFEFYSIVEALIICKEK